jgi:endonuclease/exonuclease/phosphatase family metal-dependent hydrolase
MLVISWNIQANTNARDERLGKIVDIIRGAKPDVLMLQEVAAGSLPDRLRTALAGAGLPNLAYSGDTNCQ